jgi:hypothetical protein
MAVSDILKRAKAVEAAFRVLPGIYLIGSLERGVTVYSQQTRAHNLIWALWELQKNGRRALGRVAIVGGGITGLTAAACILCRFEEYEGVSVSLFERLWDLCPIQQGSDARWLHPRIYDWPHEGSRAPGASLPVLNWSEGRASDVARTVVGKFSHHCDSYATTTDRLSVYLGLGHFQIDSRTREVTWVGNKAKRKGAFFHLDMPEGGSEIFDTIVIAAGFGIETSTQGYSSESYWRNEKIGQPILDGSLRRYLVSGYGDGALVDLCRLTIERFRQDTIVYELFQNVEEIERRFSEEIVRRGVAKNVFDLLAAVEKELLGPAKLALSNRIRKDTRVTLHLRGKDNNIKAFPQIFGPSSSFLNRLLTFLLYRCGAFAIDFSKLSNVVDRHQVPPENVLCRYGAHTMDHLLALFVRPAAVSSRLKNMKKSKIRHHAPSGYPARFHILRRPRSELCQIRSTKKIQSPFRPPLNSPYFRSWRQ